MKKKKDNNSFNILKNPYAINTYSIADIYNEYINDKYATTELGETIYYKIIQLFQFSRGAKKYSIAVLDARLQLKMNDLLVDDHGNYFEVKGFEEFRFSGSDFPKWYLKISFVVIKGDILAIGDYLARVNQEKPTSI